MATTLVTLDVGRAPDLDGMEPMRAQHGARVVNRHDRHNLAPKRSNVLDHFESTRKRASYGVGVGHAGECASIDRTPSTRRSGDRIRRNVCGTIKSANR